MKKRRSLALRVLPWLGTAAAAVLASPAAAQDQPAPDLAAARFVISGQLGYAYPAATAEQGTDTRDVSFGIVPLALAGAYDLADHWSVRARVQYAPNIPTLCASAGDCMSSVGRDVAVTVGVGRTLPCWRNVALELDLEIGWEWLTTKLSDASITTERSWNGPVAILEVFANLKGYGPWRVGPTVGIATGLFSHFDLDTPAGHTGGGTATAIHSWPMIGFRAGRRL